MRVKNSYGEQYEIKNGAIAAVVGAVLLILFLSVLVIGRPIKKVSAGSVALHYQGGPFDGRSYEGTHVGPKGITWTGPFDKWYTYPTSLRSYIVSLQGDGDRKGADSISAYSADRIVMQYEVTVNFKLNTSLVREFHENLSTKYKAWNEGDGWDLMLNDTFRKPLENALLSQSRAWTAEQLATAPDVLKALQDRVAQDVNRQIISQTGSEFFCGPTYEDAADCGDVQVIINSARVPTEIETAWKSQQQSEAQIITAQNEAKAKVERAAGDAASQQALQGIFSDPNYVAYLRALAQQECAKNPNCTLVITDGGTGINVNTGG